MPGPVTDWISRPGAGQRYWVSVASSADGTRLVAAPSYGYLYTSNDSGETWTARLTDAKRAWRAVACSSDGMQIVAAINEGSIRRSVNGGMSWTICPGTDFRYWSALASAADGVTLAAADYSSGLSISANSGATWDARLAFMEVGASVAVSADGLRIAVTVEGRAVHLSSDRGATWTERTVAPSGAYVSRIACSADGTRLVAVGSNNSLGLIYTSSDSGVSWIARPSLPYAGRYPSGVTCSADGMQLAVCTGAGVYLSSDNGITWAFCDSLGTKNCIDIDSSDDGARLVAVVNNDFIYTSEVSFPLDTVRARHQAPSGAMAMARARHRASYLIADHAVASAHRSGWAVRQRVSARHESGWQATNTARQAHRADWAMRRRAVQMHSGAWMPLGTVSACHAALFDYSAPVAQRHAVLFDYSAPVAQRHAVLFGATAPISGRHRATWIMSRPVAVRHVTPAALLTADPVAAHHRAHAAMSDTAMRVVELPLQLIHAGRRVDLGDPLELSCDDGSSTWAATIYLDDPSEFARLRVGDALTLQVGPETVALMIDALQHSRAESPTYQVSALSPVARFGSPYAAPIRLGAAGMARAVCERLLGQAIDWRLPDWRLPESAAELEDTPLALAQQIVGVVGGRLESRLDGALLARPAAPVSPPQYATASAVRLGDDQLYAYSAQIDAPQIANRFVITSGDDASTADTDQIQVEAIADESDPHAYTVRAYPTPWRPVTLVHTGDSATAIRARTEVQTEHAELVEITAGTARLRYPVHAITATRWQYADLGAVRLSDPQTLTAGGAESYSLLHITYRARAWEWRVTNARTETIQFLAVE